MAQLPDDQNPNHSLMDDIKVSDNYKDHDDLDDFNDNDSLKNNVDGNDFDQEDVHHAMIQQRDDRDAAPSPPPTNTLTASSLQNFDNQNPPQSMLDSTKLAQNAASQPAFDLANLMNDWRGGGDAIPDLLIDQLVDMGFSRDKALHALKIVEYPSVDLACQWLFDHPEFEPQDTSKIAATISNLLGSNEHDLLGLANNNNVHNGDGHNPLPPNNSPDHNSGGLVGIPSGNDGYTKPTIDDQHKDDNTFMFGLIDAIAQGSGVKSKSNRVYEHKPTLGSAATDPHLDEEKNPNHTESKAADEHESKHNENTKPPPAESKNDEDEFSAPLPIASQIYHQTSTSNVTSEISTLSTGLRSQSPSIHNNNNTNTNTNNKQNGGTKEQLSQLYQQQHQLDAINRNNVSVDMIPQDLKMVLVVRKDLKMTSGKVAAQCCHACLGVVMDILDKKYGGNVNDNGNSNNNGGRSSYDLRLVLRLWRMNGEKKIVLQCKNEQKMLELRQQAVIHNLPHYLVSDAGHTQIAAGSKTVLAIGPYPSADIDIVTKELKLY